MQVECFVNFFLKTYLKAMWISDQFEQDQPSGYAMTPASHYKEIWLNLKIAMKESNVVVIGNFIGDENLLSFIYEFLDQKLSL